jgi:hypothetical protein
MKEHKLNKDCWCEPEVINVHNLPLSERLSGYLFTEIHQAIGQASMCWEPRPSTEVFKAEEASNIAFELCHKIANEIDKYKSRGPERKEVPMEGRKWPYNTQLARIIRILKEGK